MLEVNDPSGFIGSAEEALAGIDLPPDIVRYILDDLRKNLGGDTSGKKKRVVMPWENAGPVNFIPSSVQGPCAPFLYAFCLDRDNFNMRLKEISDHAGIICPKTTHVILITSQWRPVDWERQHRAVYERLAARVYIFLAAFNRLVRMV